MIRQQKKFSVGLSAASLLIVSLLTACSDPRTEGLSLGEERSTSDEAKITEEMISAIKEVSFERMRNGQHVRFNQPKTLGCLDATFDVVDDLSEELGQGLFSSSASYPAKIRFANATKFDDREKDFRGMSISVSNVSGETLWGEQGRQDFLLNSHPVLFAKDGTDFLEFIEASRGDKIWKYFIRPSHFYSLKIAMSGREKISNPFGIRYWSTTPFRHGLDESVAVKYSVQRCANSSVLAADADSDNFLTQAMAASLEDAPACFDFMVQFQTDPQDMPIENASKLWDEEDSPFYKVAEIMIRKQDFNTPENQAACEAMTFNPWQSLEEHQPLGDINRLRKAVYSEMGDFRTNQNAQ